MKTEDITGSPFCVRPVEKHVFQGDDYECEICSRPRALHFKTGFISAQTRHSVSMDPKARYGRHPYFWKPKSIQLSKQEQEQVDRACKR